MFFKKKEDNKFLNYSDKIKKLLSKKKYDSALALYTKFKINYEKLSRDEKEKGFYDYNNIMNQLLIYTKLEELRIIIKRNNLDLIRDSLNFIDHLINNTYEIGSNYLNYVKEEYNNYFSIFHFKLISSELNEKLEEVYKFRDEQNYELALNLFPELMNKYKEIESSSLESRKMYKKLIDLREELKMELLKFRAHSKVAKVNLKSLKKALKEKEVESAKKLHEEIFS